MLGWLVEQIAERIAGRPNAPRWAWITALFGWSAAAGLIVWVLASAFGATDVARRGIAAFSFLIVIAVSLDFKRIRGG